MNTKNSNEMGASHGKALREEGKSTNMPGVMDFRTYLRQHPDKNGYYGRFGGAYLPKELEPAFKEITEAYNSICHSAQFISELRRIRKQFQGRPTPVYHCERLSRLNGGAQI